MDYDELKARLGANIAAYRRKAGLTQAELAQKLNYSDKAVSKWERGESVPDVLVLLQLAQALDTSLDTLVQGTAAPKAAKKARANLSVIQMLCSLLVWLVAMTVFVILSACDVPTCAIVFVYALPVNAVVLLCLRSAWRMFGWNRILISILLWSCLVSLHLTMLVYVHVNIWKIYLLGLLGQAAVVLWFHLFPKNTEAAHG